MQRRTVRFSRPAISLASAAAASVVVLKRGVAGLLQPLPGRLLAHKVDVVEVLVVVIARVARSQPRVHLGLALQRAAAGLQLCVWRLQAARFQCSPMAGPPRLGLVCGDGA